VRNGPVEAILLVLVIHRRVENVNKDGGEGGHVTAGHCSVAAAPGQV